ncbi:MAG: biotin--[acetyl-CoA-carboxylase] ligase [Hyphomonadaceae bacterium]
MIEARAPLLIFEEIDSTNEEARRRAASSDAGPVFLLARRQTAGRGRRGRSWTTLPGNLFLTYLGATAHPPAMIALLGFAAGLALWDFCESVAPGRARLKWPNDLLLDGAKAAGVLLESGAMEDERNWFAVGVGFNLAGAPGDAGQPAAALRDVLATETVPPPPEAVATDFAARLAGWAAILERDGFAPLRTAWAKAAHGLGGPVAIDLGGERIAGRALGLSAAGEFEIETEAGVRRIAAGDLYFPPATA